jgi:transposase
MAVRHPLSKLLLRQGIVYYGGKAWTSEHELRLRRQRFDSPALQLAYDTTFDAMLFGRQCGLDCRERAQASKIELLEADATTRARMRASSSAATAQSTLPNVVLSQLPCRIQG